MRQRVWACLGRASRRWLGHAFIWAVLAVAAVLWTVSIGGIDVHQVTDIGLVSVVPPVMYVSLGLVALGFTLSMRLAAPSKALMLTATLLAVVMIHGLPTMVEDAPRFATAYLHAGFTDTIAHQGELLPRVDARFNWPLFFTLGAFVTQIADIGNAIELQQWAALVANVLYLLPLLLIFGALTSDRRQVWAAAFVFYAANWIGQDYYSPQAFNYLIYLTAIAIILRWFRRTSVPRWLAATLRRIDRRLPGLRAPMLKEAPDEPPVVIPARAGQRVALVGVLVLLIGVSVASHQLTPFALLAAVSALAVLGRTQLGGLPVLVAVLIGAWVSYMTVAFLAGHLVGLLTDLGSPAEAASAGVVRRLSGSPGHVFIVQFRLFMTLGFWVLAALGALRRFRHGYLDLEAFALATVPFGFLLLQAYGGEILLRIYLFSLPFMAFLVTGLFFPSPRPLTWPTSRAIAVVTAAMLIAVLVAKHGNERADMITADELAAVNYVYATAPPESVLAVVNTWGAIRYRDFREYRYAQVPEAFLSEDLDQLVTELESDAPCTYLVITRSEQAAAEMFWGYTPGEWQHAEDVVLQSGMFDELYASRDAMVLISERAPPACRREAEVAG